MIDRSHDLPLTRQAEVLHLSCGNLYYLPRPVSAVDLAIMGRIDKLHLEFPFAGSRMLRNFLHDDGIKVGRDHVITLMRRMGVEALCPADDPALRHSGIQAPLRDAAGSASPGGLRSFPDSLHR